MTWENRLIFEVSSADPDSDTPVWVDLTSRVNDMAQRVEVNIGRQNDLEQAEPTTWTMTLNNADDALTYGNTSSPYPWWGPGRKCRLRETIGGTIIPLATGYLQTPTENVGLSGIDQQVVVSIVDRLGRLQVSEPFLSVLAEQIKYAGLSNGLKFYAPLADNFADIVGGLSRNTTNTVVSNSGAGGVSLSLSNGAIAPADDSSHTATFAATGVDGRIEQLLWIPAANAFPIGTGQVATAVAWVKPTSGGAALFFTTAETGPSGNSFVQLQSFGGVWRATVSGTSVSGSLITGVTGNADPTWLVGLRFGFNPAVLEVWLNNQRFVGSLSGSPPATNYINQIFAPVNSFTGQISHAQLYVGQPTDFDFAAFQAQYQMGQFGLERQLTGDRIRTVAQYARIPNAEIANTIDPGSSVMQRAQLAGRTPLDTMREAETTEQGLLYVDGSGNLVFKDRRTLYNI